MNLNIEHWAAIGILLLGGLLLFANFASVKFNAAI